MKDNYDLGQIVKFYRIKNKIKQNVLCEGICTPSYLSRIENSLVKADREIYELLFLRLGLNVDSMFKENIEVNSRVNQIYEELLFNNKTKENYDDFFQAIPFTNNDFFVEYQIIYSRYLFSANQFDEALLIYQHLKKLKSNFSERNAFLFKSLSVYIALLTKNYNEALDYIKELNFNSILSYKKIEQGIFFYNLGLIYCHIKNYSNSLSFIRRALKIFSEIYLPKHELNCHITLGIIYNNLNLHKKATSHYEKALSILNQLNKDVKNNTSLNMILTNLGYNFECQHQFELAENYYKQALQSSISIDIHNHINLIRLYYLSNKKKQSVEYLEILLNLDSIIEEKYDYQIKIFKLMLIERNPSINKITSLQKASLEYFLENKMYTLFIYYSECFAKIYEGLNIYKMAYELLQSCLEVKKNMNLEVI